MYGIRNSTADISIRWPLVTIIFGYTLLVRLLPYVLHRFGMQLNPDVSYYPWNFSPAFAVCLFSGTFCTDRRLSGVLPLGTFLLSDLGIWALTGRVEWAFYPWQFVVYGCLLFCTMLGFLHREKRSPIRIAGTGLLGCAVFFVATNFAVWALGTTYQRTPAGLAECYVAAIPYFRNSVVGTAFFGAVLFSPFCIQQSAVSLSGRELAKQRLES